MNAHNETLNLKFPIIVIIVIIIIIQTYVVD